MTDATQIATLHTTAGDIRVQLYGNHAPKTVKNFVDLATGGVEWKHPQTGQKSNDPLYDGTIFHRVIAGFMIQGGDPLGEGYGGPGYQFKDEFHPELVFDRPYLLAMANSGPNTNGSQFFITVGPTPHLNRSTRSSARSPTPTAGPWSTPSPPPRPAAATSRSSRSPSIR